jgi:hypothetical protein
LKKPSVLLYIAIGETTMRFFRVIDLQVMGLNSLGDLLLNDTTSPVAGVLFSPALLTEKWVIF